MGEQTGIAWCDSTLNPWVGCTKVSPACDFCYAERDMDHRRHFVQWGFGKLRRRTTESTWNNARRWEAAHAEFRAHHKRPRRVFCASLADVFDGEVLPSWRGDLFTLIAETPHLEWLLLTKRAGNIPRMLPHHFTSQTFPNVWLGISVATQHEAERDIPKLAKLDAAVRFVSFEPLLEMVEPDLKGIHWAIVGGESGPQARPLDRAWVSVLLAAARRHGSAFFMKQGSQANWERFNDFRSFPPEIQIREWPR